MLGSVCALSPTDAQSADLAVFNGTGDQVSLDNGTNTFVLPFGSSSLFALPDGTYSLTSSNLGSLSFDLGTNHSRLMLSSDSGALVASVSVDPDRLPEDAPEIGSHFFRGFVLILGPGLLFLFALRPLRRFFSSGI